MVLLLSSAVLIVVIVQLVGLSTANIEPSLPAVYKNQWQRYMLMGMHRIGRSGIEQILSRIAYEQRQRLEERMMSKRERGCMINAGLSQGCDMSDMIISKQQQAKLSSFLTPGRK